MYAYPGKLMGGEFGQDARWAKSPLFSGLAPGAVRRASGAAAPDPGTRGAVRGGEIPSLWERAPPTAFADRRHQRRPERVHLRPPRRRRAAELLRRQLLPGRPPATSGSGSPFPATGARRSTPTPPRTGAATRAISRPSSARPSRATVSPSARRISPAATGGGLVGPGAVTGREGGVRAGRVRRRRCRDCRRCAPSGRVAGHGRATAGSAWRQRGRLLGVLAAAGSLGAGGARGGMAFTPDQAAAEQANETLERELDTSSRCGSRAELSEVEAALTVPRCRHVRPLRDLRQRDRRRPAGGDAGGPPVPAPTKRARAGIPQVGALKPARGPAGSAPAARQGASP